MRDLLILALLAATTVNYRVEAGGFSFALLEPVALLVVAVLLADRIAKGWRLRLPRDHFAITLAGIAVWAALLRPWASNWQHGASDARDWLLPVIVFLVLSTTVRSGRQRWIGPILALVALSALVGLYQHFTDSFRPFASQLSTYKTGFAIDPESRELALAPFAVGFMAHPNNFALFLVAGLFLALGWSFKPPFRVTRLALPLVIWAALWYTYAKTSIVIALFVVLLFLVERRCRSERTLLVTLAGLGALVATGIIIAARVLPAAYLDTFTWRVGLWQTAVRVIAENPGVLLRGSGLDLFATQAYYPQPHNLYLYLLLEYGLVGLAAGLLLLWYVLRTGWRARRAGLFRRDPVIAALWLALLAYFAIGLLESNLMGIESRMLFVFILGWFVGLQSEARRAAPAPEGDTAREGSLAAAPASSYHI